MAYFRGDVASCGFGEHRFTGQWFPRTDMSPSGAWVNVDCDPSGANVYAETSAGERYDLGGRHPDNPICVRWVEARQVFKVAWVDRGAGGQTFDIDGEGYKVAGSEGTYDASGAGSQGILDIDESGTILFKDGNDVRYVDGLALLHWRVRNGRIVGVLHTDWLGISVFVLATGKWYRAFPYDIQLLPGLADNGTVAATGEGGGFIERADWLTREFNPHATPHDDAPHTDTPIHVDAPHVDAPVHTDAPHSDAPHTDAPHDDIPIPIGEDMNRNLVLVGKTWHHVEEVDHPDAGPEHGPVVGVRRVSDGHMLKVRHDGKVEFEEGTPGADERLIPAGGAFAALREVNASIPRVGPWTV